AELACQPAGSDALAVTFDDGFASVSDAWPMLRDRGIPVTMFVATDHVGGFNAWGQPGGMQIPRLRLLDWDALGRMAGQGLEIGSHSRTHADLRLASPDEIADEVERSADTIRERLGLRPTVFAYPYGGYTPGVLAAAGAVYQYACTTDFRLASPADDPHALPRLDAYYFRSAGSLESWGSVRARLRLGARAVARGIRRRVVRQ
ncbi:MAG: polysaccharide deacetylase family protein, partial [Gemmatimonadota bacterium]|nr:polysaccharide deacetylase family protein [Gemmatimonadota bacterium]